MIRLWIATALLAGSWLLGLDYFYPASPWVWLATVAAGVALLSRIADVADDAIAGGGSRRLTEAAAIILLLPAVWLAVWPYRAAPLLLATGLAIQLLPIRKAWPKRLACGAVAAGMVMLVQGMALELYASRTASSHDLPWPLPELLSGIAGLLGIDAAAVGSSVVIHSMRQVHRLAATWELLLDPATWLFFVGGLTMLALRRHRSFATGHSACFRWSAWLRDAQWFALVVLAWLPLRAGLLMGLYLHRVLRSDPDRPLHAMNHLFSPWMLLVLLLAPVLLAWRFVRVAPLAGGANAESGEEKGGGRRGRGETGKEAAISPAAVRLPPYPFRIPAAAGLIALSIALFTAAIYWNPVGPRREGRVMVVERHSQWEPTTKPYDTTWFAEPPLFGESSGYNYAAVYAYLGQYYQMSRLLESDKIDDQTLDKCDVLVIKIPTARYSKAEADAVVRFVEQGGGLMLIGDHTNYARSSTVMNDITRPMGFTFRDDLLFSFAESPYEQLYERPLVPHPSVQHVPAMDFAVSCSIDPGRSRGRSVITSTGLWSMGPEYHADNYHPVPQHCPEMRYGPFVQTWAAWHGLGRAIAFTDSTIFSNFCVFQPGKAELMRGMVEWLNHGNPPVNPRPWLLLLGLLPLLGGLRMCRPIVTQPDMAGAWLPLLAAGTCGWVAAALAVTAAHRWAMPAPAPLRPLNRVVIDRNLSTVPLAKGMYNRGDGEGYGMLEAWIPRLGCYTVRKAGSEVFSGDALVVICPSRSVSEEYRENLRNFVEQGGKLLVIDSPENTRSTANGVLWPFGLAIHHDREWKGRLSTAAALPAVDVAGANEVAGGRPLVNLGQTPVAAALEFGKGSVMAVGFGALWNDKSMGQHAPEDSWETAWGLEPDATVRARYDLLFGLLRPLLENKPLKEAPLPTIQKVPEEMEPRQMAPKGKEILELREAGPAEL